MKLHTTLHRLTLTALLLTTAMLTFAPAAQADSWRHDRRSHGRWGWSAPRVVYRERGYERGGAGPMFAGLIGGLIIGSAISHAQPVIVHQQECAPPPPVVVRDREYAAPPPAYRYEDGNGERWWDTLDECTQAAYDQHGPRVIHEVDARNDRLVRTLYWKHDHWISDDDDWDGR